MGSPAKRIATYADIEALPAGVNGEIVDGELFVSPRPAMPHALVGSSIGVEIGGPFWKGRGGPGGWVIVYEPELHLGADVLAPDWAGWRRERMPENTEVVPDWVCEILSPSTARLDRVRKMPVYAREKVPHVWIVDPALQTLEVYRLEEHGYVLVMSAAEAEKVRAEPFDAIELDLASLWGR